MLIHCKKQKDKVIYLHGMTPVGQSALFNKILKLVAGNNMVLLSNKVGNFQFDTINDATILF